MPTKICKNARRALRTKSKRCHLLELPLELRLEIYNHALFDSEIITIASAPVVGPVPELLGVPPTHQPIVRPHYDPALLSLRHPRTSLVMTEGESTSTQASRDDLPAGGLLLANKQIQNEIFSEMIHLYNTRSSSLFVSYPHGIHVLTRLCPHFLHRARSIHISGVFEEDIDEALHAETLARMVRSLLGSHESESKSKTRIQKFEMRILYAGARPHWSVWTHENSPIVVALRNFSGGKHDVEVWRSKSYGTGVYLTSTPNPSRLASSVWRDLPDSKAEDFVVDPKWPKWDAEYPGPVPR
ncbi:hypothetical protein EV356DRAFT_529253 [Viridothelium virens]|uniref:Uncharacterized protein n=1 Tax=Viridothelium virens TaxID=1048519 RepID=A0A6A6HJD5_VIRVR|nr:hypothetical protein EV356DRAFT_529253 [Viridothelium virens]